MNHLFADPVDRCDKKTEENYRYDYHNGGLHQFLAPRPGTLLEFRHNLIIIIANPMDRVLHALTDLTYLNILYNAIR